MTRINVSEDRKVTMTSFLNGLNKDTTNVFELLFYSIFNDLNKLLSEKKIYFKIFSNKKLTRKSSWKKESYFYYIFLCG